MKRVLCLLSVLLICGLLAGCGGSTVDLMEYADVRFTGLDTQGLASVEIESSDLEAVLLDHLSGTELEKMSALLMLEGSIQYAAEPSENLANGDTVILSVTWDADIADEYGLKFKGNSREVPVADLKDAQTVDLFAGIEIDYSGVSPDLTAQVRNTSDDAFLKTVQYSVQPMHGIAKGDTVTVTATYNSAEAEKYGYIPKETTAEFTVEQADAYITEFGQIPADILAEMDQQARDTIESAVADQYGYRRYMHPGEFLLELRFDSVQIQSLDCKEYQFFCLKKGGSVGYGDAYNSVVMVYELHATDNVYPDGATVYLPVRFSNIILRENGAVDVVLTDAVITDARSKSYDDLYRDTVTAQKAQYTYEIIEEVVPAGT